jgi:glycosyltransferase involved in cell wall biosynthesis
MTVYGGEQPAALALALRGLAAQSRPAEEVVLVKDGPLGAELEQTIARFEGQLPLVVLALPKVGRGSALQAGVERCKGEWIAIADSDDVSVPERFARQLEMARQHPEIDVEGGVIAEFDRDPSRVCTLRLPPVGEKAIRRFARWRNPINHSSVILRRSAVLRAGNYSSLCLCQDYELIVRMLLQGSRIYNGREVLSLVRSGKGMLQRRGGWQYLRLEAELQRSYIRMGFLSPWQAAVNLLLRAPVRLAPAWLRRCVYQHLLRHRPPAAAEGSKFQSHWPPVA